MESASTADKNEHPRNHGTPVAAAIDARDQPMPACPQRHKEMNQGVTSMKCFGSNLHTWQWLVPTPKGHRVGE
jgi:hypothetical protein